MTPHPTDTDRMLLHNYEIADGALNFFDLVCLSGVVMLSVTFFERVGRAPTAADRASSANLLQELGVQSAGVGARNFMKHTLAHWQEQLRVYHPRYGSRQLDRFQEELVAQTGVTTKEALTIAVKLKGLAWSTWRFELATEELARVRKLYGAATSFFKAAAAKAPGCAFAVTLQQLARGFEDALEFTMSVGGKSIPLGSGINRWQQFSIGQRSVEWQKVYTKSPQSFYELLISFSPSSLGQFGTSIWLRELDKLQRRLQELDHDNGESNLQFDPKEFKFRLDPLGQPDALSVHEAEATAFRFHPQWSPLPPVEIPQLRRRRLSKLGQPDFAWLAG